MITRKFVDAVISKGWKPYIESRWIDFTSQRGGATITFKGHEEHKYKCSNKTATEILNHKPS